MAIYFKIYLVKNIFEIIGSNPIKVNNIIISVSIVKEELIILSILLPIKIIIIVPGNIPICETI